MSVKNTEYVQRYVHEVAGLRAALANLAEFVDTLPAPDDAGELPTMHYGHLGTVSAIHVRIGELSRMADEMYARDASR